MSDDFEIIEGGEQRIVQIGRSWDELNETMKLYYPYDAERGGQYARILQHIVDKGMLEGWKVRLTPSGEDNLDLSDKRIEEATERFKGEA